MTTRRICFIVISIFFLSQLNLLANVRFYSFETATNTQLSRIENSLFSKKVYSNNFFQKKSFGLSLKEGSLCNYTFTYGYGLYVKSFSNLKVLISLDSILYLQKSANVNYLILTNVSVMKRISEKYSYNVGIVIPTIEFQDSRFSDILIILSINRFFNSKFNSRQSSKYLKSIKKKVLWFWVNDK